MKHLLAGVGVVLFVAGVLLFDAGPAEPSDRSTAAVVVAQSTVQTVCPFTRSKIQEHRQATWATQRMLHRTLTRKSTVPVVGCGYARWVENLWWKRSVALAKRARWVVLPDMRDWATAVEVAQRVYPGTASWLMSCSGAEGGHGRWVWYGGRSWSGRHIGNDFLGMDTVGGWMQFRFSTFDPYSEWAFASVRRRGFHIPAWPGRYDAWLSPLGQALTAGYMRFYGRDGHHWSASSGNGC